MDKILELIEPKFEFFTCPRCRLGGYPADDRLGLHGRLSERARQLITLAGVSQSFRHGSLLLERLAGWTTRQEIVRPVCYHPSGDRPSGLLSPSLLNDFGATASG